MWRQLSRAYLHAFRFFYKRTINRYFRRTKSVQFWRIRFIFNILHRRVLSFFPTWPLLFARLTRCVILILCMRLYVNWTVRISHFHVGRTALTSILICCEYFDDDDDCHTSTTRCAYILECGQITWNINYDKYINIYSRRSYVYYEACIYRI